MSKETLEEKLLTLWFVVMVVCVVSFVVTCFRILLFCCKWSFKIFFKGWKKVFSGNINGVTDIIIGAFVLFPFFSLVLSFTFLKGNGSGYFLLFAPFFLIFILFYFILFRALAAEKIWVSIVYADGFDVKAEKIETGEVLNYKVVGFMRNHFKPDENYHRIYVCDNYIVLEEELTVKKYEKIKSKYMDKNKKEKNRKIIFIFLFLIMNVVIHSIVAVSSHFGFIEAVIVAVSLIFLLLGYFSYTALFVSLGETLSLLFAAINPIAIPTYFSGIIMVWGLFVLVGFLIDIIRCFAPKKYEIEFVAQNEQRNKIEKEIDPDRYYI